MLIFFVSFFRADDAMRPNSKFGRHTEPIRMKSCGRSRGHLPGAAYPKNL
jgi:hypothetical protein